MNVNNMISNLGIVLNSMPDLVREKADEAVAPKLEEAIHELVNFVDNLEGIAEEGADVPVLTDDVIVGLRKYAHKRFEIPSEEAEESEQE